MYFPPKEPGLPNLLILGQQKAGTTWLFSRLMNHPEIQGSQPKEVFFFNQKRATEKEHIAEYKKRFPTQAGVRYYMEGSASYSWIREAGDPWDNPKWAPSQCWATHSHARTILGGQASFVVLFRHPIARAISGFYHHFLRRRFAPDARLIEVGKSHGIIAMGKVQHSMKCWTGAFSPEQFLFLNFDNIKTEPQALVQRCYEFLELDPPPKTDPAASIPAGKNSGFKLAVGDGCIRVDASSNAKSNRRFFGVVPRPLRGVAAKIGVVKDMATPTVSFEEIEALREIYMPEIDYIERLLDQDLSHWRTATPEDLLKL